MDNKERQAIIAADEYKGMRAIRIENDLASARMVPELGGKLVSLRHKPTGREWLLDSGARPLRPLTPQSVFAESDLSGWDECFPTINACNITAAGRDIELPDHGEVWPLPWETRIEAGRVVGSVRGVRLPYRLTRAVSLADDGVVQLDYAADNIGDAPFPFLWAAHPQFAVTEPTRILFPQEVEHVLCVYGGRKRETGAVYAWDGQQRIGPEMDGDGVKFYCDGVLREGWAGLLGEESGSYLLLKFPPERIPHLGVWVDNGLVNDRAAVALEPGIGLYDSLARAEANGTAPTLRPGERCEWRVSLAMGQGDWKARLAELRV